MDIVVNNEVSFGCILGIFTKVEFHPGKFVRAAFFVFFLWVYCILLYVHQDLYEYEIQYEAAETAIYLNQ